MNQEDIERQKLIDAPTYQSDWNHIKWRRILLFGQVCIGDHAPFRIERVVVIDVNLIKDSADSPVSEDRVKRSLKQTSQIIGEDGRKRVADKFPGHYSCGPPVAGEYIGGV